MCWQVLGLKCLLQTLWNSELGHIPSHLRQLGRWRLQSAVGNTDSLGHYKGSCKGSLRCVGQGRGLGRGLRGDMLRLVQCNLQYSLQHSPVHCMRSGDHSAQSLKGQASRH